jgi:hypothetical protein
MKFSEAPQSMSADTGVLERRGMETVMMNVDGESNEMVARRCTMPLDKETLVIQGSSRVPLAPLEIVNVVRATGLCDIDVAVVLLEVAGIAAGVAGVCGGLWRMGQLSTA